MLETPPASEGLIYHGTWPIELCVTAFHFEVRPTTVTVEHMS